MINFSLFGIPIRILPWHWVGLLIISGAFSMSSAGALPVYLLFMLAGFFCILIHELAHALVGRETEGGSAMITLEFLGGYTQQYGNRGRSKWSRVATIAAGPGINLLVFFLCLSIFFVMVDQNWELFFAFVGKLLVTPMYALQFARDNIIITQESAMSVFFLAAVMWCSCWWSLLNLLPIYPMDGGLLLDQFVKSKKTLHFICFITALIVGTVTLIYFAFNALLVVIFMAQFAYINYQLYRQES